MALSGKNEGENASREARLRGGFGRARRPQLMAGTALVGPMLALAVIAPPGAALLLSLGATPAMADGGAGGGGNGAGSAGGGGTGYAGTPGLAGGSGGLGGGGGGGGSAGGGVGGGGGTGGLTVTGGGGTAGAGGTSSSPNGQNGAGGGAGSFEGGGGGGGGGGGYNGNGAGATTITNNSSLTGGNGGNGGNGGSALAVSGAGGGGGGGGFGAIVTGAGASSNAGAIQGGAGGNGGSSLFMVYAGGGGGDGGVGVQFTTSGATFTNTASVIGGNGGAGGTGGPNGSAGAGGAGIVGAGLIVINSGTIVGGVSGAGVRANAITFTGGTNTLELQAGSTITGNVVAFSTADTLRLGGSANASFNVSQIGASAQYQGFGQFVKTGTSTWALTGTSTATSMPWSVNQGTLEVDGSLTNANMTVGNGGTLSGTGTAGGTTIQSGGTFAPGSGAPGTSMTVNGSLAFQSGAFYLVQVNPSTASLTNVTGSATLGGATVNAVFANGSYVAKQYTILTAASVSGQFNATVSNTNLPSGFKTSLSYDGTHAYLNLALSFTPPTPPGAPNFGGGLPANQQAVGNALINFFNTNGGIPLVFGTLTPAALTQISGEGATTPQHTTFNAMNQFMGILMDPFAGGRDNPVGAGSTPIGYADESVAYASSDKTRTKSERDAYAAVYSKAPPASTYEPRWSVWASGFGGSQSTDGNAATGTNNTTSRIAGTAVGADYLVSPNTLAGFALAGGGTNFSVNALGSGRSDLFQAGAYLRHWNGPAYVSGALGYGWQDITTDRTVTVAGVDHLRAEFNANAFSGRLEGGYRFVAPWIGGITPYAAAQFTSFALPAYAEQVILGANTFALAYGAKSVTDSRSELGLRSDRSFAMQDGVFTLRGRFAWAHDFNPDQSIAATFQTLPGASFVVNGAAQALDSALVTASAEKKWLNGWSAAATFEGEFSQVTRSYAGKGVVRYQW